MTQVILCGIVKDEASCIEAVLGSFRPVVDKVILCDTGSTDGTQAKVREWLKRTKTPGLIYDCPWGDLAEAKGLPKRKDGSPALFDFSVARNTACALAQAHASQYQEVIHRDGFHELYPNWLLEIDGAWYLKGQVDQLRAMLERAPADVTGFELMVNQAGASTVPYLRLRRVSECAPTRPAGWSWSGKIHEFCWRSDNVKVARVEGVWIDHIDTKDTAENRLRRYARDIEIFRDQIVDFEARDVASRPADDHERGLLTRAHFYLGQSLENSKDLRGALAAYAKRVELGGAPYEAGTAAYRAGRICKRLSDDNAAPTQEAHALRKAAAKWFLDAHAIDGQPHSLWAYAELVGGEPGRLAAWLAFESAKANKDRAQPGGFSYQEDYALAKFSAARSAAEVAARAKQMRLTGLDFEPWK